MRRALACSLGLAVLLAPAVPVGAARAERAPGPDRPQGAAPPFGDVLRTSVTGTLRLGAPSTVAVRTATVLPATTRVTATVSAPGRTCTARRTLASGLRSITLRCTLTPSTAHLGGLPVTMTLRGRAIRAGAPDVLRRSTLRLPVDDGPQLATATARTRWTALADRLDALVAGRTDTSHGPALAAQRLLRTAETLGWSSPAAAQQLTGLLALQNPDGGFGMSVPWDAFQDGTLNPASTSYTVTTAGHVGWALLEAHRHGMPVATELRRAVDSVLDRTARLDGGTCLAYSTSPHDAAAPCVYNVSFGAAAFLDAVRQDVGYRAGDIDALVGAVRAALSAGYDRATGYWVYKAGNTMPQDMSHQVYTARSADALDPGFGAVTRMMSVPWWRHPNGLSQPAHVVSSSMIAVAADCRLARSPGLLAGAELGARASDPVFAVQSMARVARAVATDCLGPSALGGAAGPAGRGPAPLAVAPGPS